MTDRQHQAPPPQLHWTTRRGPESPKRQARRPPKPSTKLSIRPEGHLAVPGRQPLGPADSSPGDCDTNFVGLNRQIECETTNGGYQVR